LSCRHFITSTICRFWQLLFSTIYQFKNMTFRQYVASATCFLQCVVPQFAILKLRILKLCILKLRILKLCILKLCILKLCILKLCILKLCILKLCILKLGIICKIWHYTIWSSTKTYIVPYHPTDP
jgi:hypothetical protein